MNYAEDFTLYVSTMTSGGERYLTYHPYAGTNYSETAYYHIFLGNGLTDGSWHRFERDLSADLRQLAPTETLQSVEGLLIRGSGKLDDIALASAPGANTGGGSGTSGTILAYLHTDHLGTPVAATDASKKVIWHADADPFGQTTPTGSLTLNLRFPGQYYDAETGLHYNYFRDYDPGIGRYLESDPIGLLGGVNTYAYVKNNPIYRIDPFGLHDLGPFIGGWIGNILDWIDPPPPANDNDDYCEKLFQEILAIRLAISALENQRIDSLFLRKELEAKEKEFNENCTDDCPGKKRYNR